MPSQLLAIIFVVAAGVIIIVLARIFIIVWSRDRHIIPKNQTENV